MPRISNPVNYGEFLHLQQIPLTFSHIAIINTCRWYKPITTLRYTKSPMSHHNNLTLVLDVAEHHTCLYDTTRSQYAFIASLFLLFLLSMFLFLMWSCAFFLGLPITTNSVLSLWHCHVCIFPSVCLLAILALSSVNCCCSAIWQHCAIFPIIPHTILTICTRGWRSDYTATDCNFAMHKTSWCAPPTKGCRNRSRPALQPIPSHFCEWL